MQSSNQKNFYRFTIFRVILGQKQSFLYRSNISIFSAVAKTFPFYYKCIHIFFEIVAILIILNQNYLIFFLSLNELISILFCKSFFSLILFVQFLTLKFSLNCYVNYPKLVYLYIFTEFNLFYLLYF